MAPISFTRRAVPGDELPRRVCNACEFIDYENPRVIVGAVVTSDDGRYLLCKRAIEPRHGFWTLPAGFLEQHESVEEGARREAREEAMCELDMDGLLAAYTVLHISQVQLFFRARLRGADFSPGAESLAVALFAWDEIPWDELAFPTVRAALEHHRRGQEAPPAYAMFSRSPDNPPRNW